MNPLMTQELTRIKIAEQLQYAERQRQARLAVNDQPRSIDFSGLGNGIRRLLLGGRKPGAATAARAGA
jgi:hypothetical protein